MHWFIHAHWWLTNINYKTFTRRKTIEQSTRIVLTVSQARKPSGKIGVNRINYYKFDAWNSHYNVTLLLHREKKKIKWTTKTRNNEIILFGEKYRCDFACTMAFLLLAEKKSDGKEWKNTRTYEFLPFNLLDGACEIDLIALIWYIVNGFNNICTRV